MFDAKRLIGRKFADPVVQADIKLWPFKVESGQGDKPIIVVNAQGEQKKFHPEEISSMVLLKMKETAEAYLGTKVNDAAAKSLQNTFDLFPVFFLFGFCSSLFAVRIACLFKFFSSKLVCFWWHMTEIGVARLKWPDKTLLNNWPPTTFLQEPNCSHLPPTVDPKLHDPMLPTLFHLGSFARAHGPGFLNAESDRWGQSRCTEPTGTEQVLQTRFVNARFVSIQLCCGSLVHLIGLDNERLK